MADCVYCTADAQLVHGGVPICIACADRRESNRRALEMDKRVRLTLIRELVDAHARTESFSEDQRNPTSELFAARKEMTKARSRLTDFLNGGIVPEDLKRNGGH